MYESYNREYQSPLLKAMRKLCKQYADEIYYDLKTSSYPGDYVLSEIPVVSPKSTFAVHNAVRNDWEKLGHWQKN